MYAAQQASGYVGGQAPMTAVAEREIPAQVNELEESIAMLVKAADDLCGRLTPIRRQVGNAIAGDSANVPQPILCPMATLLREVRRRVDGVRMQLGTACSELEV